MRFNLRFSTRERLMLVVIALLGVALLAQRIRNQAIVAQLQRESKNARWMTYANDGVLRKNGYKVVNGKLVKDEPQP
jgi:ABC-type antimicrobial peptide transport system permease subunit